jgi:hypothetical protein
MSALDDYLMPFAMIYELASLTLDRLRHRHTHFWQRCSP